MVLLLQKYREYISELETENSELERQVVSLKATNNKALEALEKVSLKLDKKNDTISELTSYAVSLAKVNDKLFKFIIDGKMPI